jgi:hypothetical protein
MKCYGASSSSLCLRMQRIVVNSSNSSGRWNRMNAVTPAAVLARSSSSSSSSNTRSFVTESPTTTATTPTFASLLMVRDASEKRVLQKNAYCNTTMYTLRKQSFSSSSSDTATPRETTTTTAAQGPASLKMYYHIEASNAERDNATKLTVHGPDVDGILASMTVALAVKMGCSLVELHAANMVDDNHDLGHDKVYDDDNYHFIHDVFWVVQRKNGQAFADDQLHDLALCLLEAAQSPMTVVVGECGQDKQQALQDYLRREKVPVPPRQITVIPRSGTSSSSSSGTTRT